MGYDIEFIVSALRIAREARGLSQRELSAKSGVPQGHISKIENNVVDLRVSSLVALARALGLEPMLVSRKFIPAVQLIVSNAPQDGNDDTESVRPAYRLEEDEHG